MPSRDDILANITTGPGRPSRGDILAGMTGGAQGPLVDLVKGSKAAPQRTPITTAELFPRAAPVALPPAPEPEPGPFEFAGPLGKFIDLIDTPRAALVSTIKETGDLFRGEGFSPTDWWKQTEGNLFMQDVMRDWGVDLPGPLDMVVGLGFDIAFDPITYMTGGIGAAGRAGMNAPRLIKAMSRGASYYDDIAKAGGKAGVTLTQAQHKAGVLKQAVLDVGKSNAMNAASREALQEVGLLGQMGLFVPTTGRLGRGLRLDKVLDKATRGGVMARRARQASRLPYIDDLARPVAGRTLDDATEAVARFGREGLEDAAAAEAKILERMKMIAGREALPDVADDFYTAAARMAARMPVEAVRLPGFTGKVLSSTVPQFGKAKANLMGRKPVEMIDTAFNTRSSIKEGLRSGDYETVLGANKAMTSNSAGWAARNRFMDVMSKTALQMRRRARKLGMSEEVVDDLWKTELWDYAPGSKAPRVGVDGLPVMNPEFRQKFGVYMEQAGEAAITDFWGQGRKWMDDALVNANILGGSNWLSASADELWVMRLALESATDNTAARNLIPGAKFRGVPLLSQVDDPLKRTVEEQIRAIANSELGDKADELFDRNIWRAMDRYLSTIGEGVRRAKVMNLLEEQGVVFKEPLAWIKGQVDEGYDALRGLYGNRGDAFNEVFRAIEQGFDAEQVKAMRMAAAARDGASKMGEQTAAWVAEVELLESRLVEIQARLVDKMTDVAGQARRSSDALGEFMKPLLQEASVLGYRYAQLQAISRALTMQGKALSPTITDQKLLDELTVGFGNVQAALKAVMEDAKSVAKMDKTVDAIKDMIEALQVPLRDLDTQGLLDGVEPGMRDWISKALDIREDIAELGVEYLDLSGISLEKLPRWFSEVQDSWQDVSAAYQGAVDRGYGQTTAMNEWRRRQALAGGILLGEESPFVRLEATLRDGVWSRRVSGGAMVSEGEPLKWTRSPLEAPSLTASTGTRFPQWSIPSEAEIKIGVRLTKSSGESTGKYGRKEWMPPEVFADGDVKRGRFLPEKLEEWRAMTLEERQALRRREWREFTATGKHVIKKPGTRFDHGWTAMSAREVDGRRQIDTWRIGSLYGSGEGFEISLNGKHLDDLPTASSAKEAQAIVQAEVTKRGGLAPTAREVAAEAVTPPPAAAVAAPPADWPRYKHFTTAESKAGLIESGGAFDPSLPAAHGIMGREGEWIYDQPGMAGRRLYLSLDDARWRDVEGGPAGLESVEYAIDPKARVLVLDSEAALKAAEREIKDDLVYAGERVFDKLAEAGYDVVEIRNVARNSAPPDAVEATKVQRFFEQAGGDQIVILNNDVVRFAPEGAPTARQVAAEAVTPRIDVEGARAFLEWSRQNPRPTGLVGEPVDPATMPEAARRWVDEQTAGWWKDDINEPIRDEWVDEATAQVNVGGDESLLDVERTAVGRERFTEQVVEIETDRLGQQLERSADEVAAARALEEARDAAVVGDPAWGGFPVEEAARAAALEIPTELEVVSWSTRGPAKVVAYSDDHGYALVLRPEDTLAKKDADIMMVKRSKSDGVWYDPRPEIRVWHLDDEGMRESFRTRGFTFLDETPLAEAPSVRQVAAEAVTPPSVTRNDQVRDWLVKAKRRERSGSGPAYGYMRGGKSVQNWSQVAQDLGMDAEAFLTDTRYGRPANRVGGVGRLGASEDEVLAFVRGEYLEGATGANRPLSWPDSKPWDAAAQEKYAKKLKKYLDDLHKDLGGIEDAGSGVAPTAREVAAEAVTPPTAAAAPAASAVAARRAVARRKVFSACTEGKCELAEGATVAAEDLYTGGPFKFMRRRIDASDAELGGIISAKHGVLDPAELVESYDVQLPRLPGSKKVDRTAAKEIVAGPEQLRKFADLVGDAEELYFDGGVEYRILMRDLLKRAQARGLVGEHVRVVEPTGTAAGGGPKGIGEIKESLGKWAGEGSAAPRILEIPAEGPVWRGLAGYKTGDAYELVADLNAGEGAMLSRVSPSGEVQPTMFRIRKSKGKAGGWTVWYKRKGRMGKFERVAGGGNVRVPAKSNPDKTVMVPGVWKTLEDAKASVADELVDAVTPPPAAGAIHPDFVDEAARIETMVADEQVKAGEAAWAAGDRVYVAGPKGGPVFDEVIVRTPFGDFQLRFIGKKKGRRVQVVKAPAALKDAPSKTGPKKGGTRVPLGDGVEFQDYDTARETIGRWAEEVYETRWSGKGIVEKGAEAEVAQGAVGRLLQDPARQGGVRQALASLTGRTETTGFYGVKGLSWIDEPLWRMPLDQKMAFTEVERRLLTDAERLNHLAYAEEHYRNAESAMQQGLEAEAQIAAMQGRLRQLQAEKTVMQKAGGADQVGMAPELYDGRRTDLDLFQEDLRKFNAVRTRDLFGEALTEQTAAQWGPNTAQAGWSQGWSAPLQGEEAAPMFEMLNALFKTSSTVGDFEGFLKWYDKFLNYWKAQAVSTPGFVLRNGLGGSWLSYAFGLMELGSTNKFAGTYFRAIRGGEGDAVAGIDKMIAKLLGSGKKTVGVGFGSRVDVNELRTIRRVLDSGIVGGGQVITEVDRSVAMRLVKESRNPFTGNPIDVVFNPASTEFAPFRFIRSTNEQMETVLRGSLAFDVLQKGGSVGEAASQVYKFHFNYADLTATERKARRIIPFWTWQKNVVPILVESLGKNPVAWGRLQQVKGNMELQSKEEGVVPDYFLENMAIRLPWKINEYQSYWIPDLPFRDLNRLMKEPGSITRVFAESAAPPVKVPLEIWAGKQFFADLPFSGRYQQVPHVYDKFPFLMQALALAGKAKKDRKGEYKMRDQDLYMLDSWMPFLSRFRRLLPNESRYSRRVVSTVVSTVFGTQVRINDPHETRNQMLRDDRAFNEKMRDLIDIEMRVR